MSEKSEIIFMQTRLIRRASEEWHLPIEKVVAIFKKTVFWTILKLGMESFIVKVMTLCLKILMNFLQERG